MRVLQIRRMGYRMEVDIHGMTVAEAKKALEQFLSTVPAGVMEVTVIHGCHMGNSLQKMVRTQLSHKRIARKILSMNNGITVLELIPR